MLCDFLGLTEGTEGIASLIFFSSSSAKARQGTRQSESKIGRKGFMLDERKFFTGNDQTGKEDIVIDEE
mgnify:CR=1 FL=1